MSLADSKQITEKRARKLYYMVWIGVIWSLLYTCVSLGVMINLSNQLQDSCASRQAARSALRAVILNDPDTDANDIAQLNVNLPVKVPC